MDKILDNVNNFIESVLNTLEDKGLVAFDSISTFMAKFYAVSIFALVFLLTISSFIEYIN
jgi:hypothetical protein